MCKSKSCKLITGTSPFLRLLVHEGKLYIFIHLFQTALSKPVKTCKMRKKLLTTNTLLKIVNSFRHCETYLEAPSGTEFPHSNHI